MKANELRVGNYVEQPGRIGKVCEVWQEAIKLEGYINAYDYNHTKPILLTEQWLKDFGAKEYLGTKRSFKYSRFDLFWRDDYKYWYVTDFENETYLTKIEFVHEFQNFVFVMDGKELTKQ